MRDDTRQDAAQAIPVTVLTGFLGSGKTTLLNGLLAHPDMVDTAVLINEFGEIGLDHLLVREISGDIIQLNSGCLCCTVRGDLSDSLRELYVMRSRGDVPQFRRTVVETTGLADPAPVIQSLMTDPVIVPRYRLDGIVTTVDAILGARQLQEHPESVKQVAVADRLVLTKGDIADDDAVGAVTEQLRRLNPAAPIVRARLGDAEPQDLLDCGLFDTKRKIADVERWLNEEAYVGAEHHHAHDVNRHDDRIRRLLPDSRRPRRVEAVCHLDRDALGEPRRKTAPGERCAERRRPGQAGRHPRRPARVLPAGDACGLEQ